jgi:phytoene dehydrogenase-like protein
MRGLWKMGAVALATVVVGGSVSFAQPAALKKDLAETPPFWSGWFGDSDKPAKLEGKEPKAEPAKGAVAPTPTPTPVRPRAAAKGEAYESLRNAFSRRQAVIDKLREVAVDTNDLALADEAERLEEMAQRVFRQESGKIAGVAAVVPQPDAFDQGNGSQAVRGASPTGQPARGRGMTPESLERAAQSRGGDR